MNGENLFIFGTSDHAKVIDIAERQLLYRMLGPIDAYKHPGKFKCVRVPGVRGLPASPHGKARGHRWHCHDINTARPPIFSRKDAV